MLNLFLIDDYIKNALKEDMPFGDVTTENLIKEDSNCTVDLIAKEDGVIAGLPVFERTFYHLGSVKIDYFVKEGDHISKGTLLAKITGKTSIVLMGERVALNYLQRMSGIATLTNKCVRVLEGSKTTLLDTRKTTPNMRPFEKYAVKLGGGMNHRYSLSDSIMLKDNHIDYAGGITNAVNLVRRNASFVRKIEVECENLDMVKEALECNVEIIMLDNMDNSTIEEALKLINKKALVEVSGNVTLEKLQELSKLGVDFISSGALTHSYTSFDISMKNLKLI